MVIITTHTHRANVWLPAVNEVLRNHDRGFYIFTDINCLKVVLGSF